MLQGPTGANSSVTPLDAFNNNSLGFSFSGGGYLILYYVGVFKVLEQLGIIEPGVRAPPVAGASSGALTSAAICSGQSAQQFYDSVISMTRTCYASPLNCSGSMDKVVRRNLEGFLPKNAAERCNGTGDIAVTLFGEGGKMRNETVSVFEDRGDLISTLASSAYIPIWSGSNFSRPWRGMQAIDGSIKNDKPCPPNVTYCVRVGSRPPDMPFAKPGEDAFALILKNIEKSLTGARPLASNATKPPLPERPPAITAARAEVMKKAGLDIAPALATPNPFTSDAWSELSIIPCDPATCEYIYKMGQLDAMAWAEATGIAAAAAKRKRQQAAAAAVLKAPKGPPPAAVLRAPKAALPAAAAVKAANAGKPAAAAAAAAAVRKAPAAAATPRGAAAAGA